MMRAGEELTLDVDRPAAGGRMIARVDGRIVFVAGAIPGERVRARVERVRGGVGYAETLEPIEASPDRRPAGPDPACGGNAYAHVAYPRQLELKAAIIADAFTRIGHLAVEPPAVLGSPETGYRLRARLHVRDGRVGFYREGTHDLCDAALAGQLSDAALAVVRRLGAAIRAGHLDNATAVDLAENVDGTERAAQIDLDPARRARSQFDHVLSVEGLSGVAVTLGGRRVLAARGTLTLTDRLTLEDGVASAEVALRRHVGAFFQANRFLLPALVSRVARQVPREGTVLDLYSGSGLFAVSLAALGHQSVVAVEGDRQGVADLQANAAPFDGRLRAVGMAVEQFLADPGESAPATVLVDPPRTGLSREALDGIAGLRAPRILYVSCDVATLARDAARLVSAGYALDHLEGFDLFPNTAHVESLAVFRRGSDGPAAGA